MYNSHMMPGMPDVPFRGSFEDFVHQNLLQPMPGHSHDERTAMLQNRDNLSHMHMHMVANQHHHHHHHLPPVPTFLPSSSGELPPSPLVPSRHHHISIGHPQSPLLMASPIPSHPKQPLTPSGMQIKPEKSNNSTPSPVHGSMMNNSNNLVSRSPLNNQPQSTPPPQPSLSSFSPPAHLTAHPTSSSSSPQNLAPSAPLDSNAPASITAAVVAAAMASAKGKNGTPKKLHSCTECTDSFSQKKSLTSHLARVHGLPEGSVPIPRPHVCEVCSKAFTLLTNLKKHSIIHTGIKPYQCIECGRAFSHLVNLKSHSRTHSGIKPYQCEQCQRQFAVKSNLTKHLAVHSGVKAYACDDCGRRFSFSANLRSHMRIHSGEKPYECADCGHRFTVSSNLKKHTAAMHSGIKPTRRRRQTEPRDPLAAILKTEELDNSSIQHQQQQPLVIDVNDVVINESTENMIMDNGNNSMSANQGGCDAGVDYDDDCDEEEDDEDDDYDDESVIEMNMSTPGDINSHQN